MYVTLTDKNPEFLFQSTTHSLYSLQHSKTKTQDYYNEKDEDLYFKYSFYSFSCALCVYM